MRDLGYQVSKEDKDFCQKLGIIFENKVLKIKVIKICPYQKVCSKIDVWNVKNHRDSFLFFKFLSTQILFQNSNFNLESNSAFRIPIQVLEW